MSLPAPNVVAAGMKFAGVTDPKQIFLVIDTKGSAWIWDPIGTPWDAIVSDNMWSTSNEGEKTYHTAFIDKYIDGIGRAFPGITSEVYCRDLRIPELDIGEELEGTFRLLCFPAYGCCRVIWVDIRKARSFGYALLDSLVGGIIGAIKGFQSGGWVGAIIGGVFGGIVGGIDGLEEEVSDSLVSLANYYKDKEGKVVGDVDKGKVGPSMFAGKLGPRAESGGAVIRVNPATNPYVPGVVMDPTKHPKVADSEDTTTMLLVAAVVAFLILKKG